MSSPFLDLAQYREKVAALYAQARRPDLPLESRWQAWRAGRDDLLHSHPQSALDEAQKAVFNGLSYYPYDPSLRYVLEVATQVEPETLEMELQEDGPTRLMRFGKIHFTVQEKRVSLSLFWVLGYGGGIFLPFRDATNQKGTYGGGRYLLDTIKGAGLGWEEGGLVIDFNFAYNPSCAYNPRWHCPLAPRENWLLVEVRAGELDYSPDRG